jgi:uncharacterized protein (TIGR03000 family)
MFRSVFSLGILLVLVGAAVITTPDFALAQHRGGGLRGGAHFSGVPFGGARFGGYRGGYIGGYRYGFAHSYYPYRGYGYGYYPYSGFNYFPYSGSNYFPYSGYNYNPSYTFNPYIYNTYPYTYSGATYDPGYYGYGMPSNPDAYTYGTLPSATYQAYYPSVTATTLPAPTQLDNKAHISVSAPANGEIWFDGTKATSTGAVRHYVSPPLEAGIRYTYVVAACWNENGQEMKQAQKVVVTAGAQVNVSFPVTP